MSRPAAARVTTLPNGVRVLTMALPGRALANVSVFVRTGSQNERRRDNGISHVVEHMAFKGTAGRDCQQINLDAERLGAEANAHTDKDHTAFHTDGRARDAVAFVRMLGDIVCASTFPQAELERERAVILHEVADDDEDSLASAFKLFDTTCYGAHPFAQPVIGQRRNIARFTRDELMAYVRCRYSGSNVIVAVAGDVDAPSIEAAAAAAFGALPRGTVNSVAAPQWVGGVAARRLAGSVQTHLVLGFPIPALAERPEAHVLAAAVLGEGMSSPLLDQIRERRGLAYHVSCSADVSLLCGQLVIDASTAPEQAEPLLAEVLRLLRAHARAVDPVALQRARNQLTVRALHDAERPGRLLEAAALQLFVHGRVPPPGQRLARIKAVTAAQVHQAFAAMLAAGPALAIAGRVRNGLADRMRALLAVRSSVHLKR